MANTEEYYELLQQLHDAEEVLHNCIDNTFVWQIVCCVEAIVIVWLGFCLQR